MQIEIPDSLDPFFPPQLHVTTPLAQALNRLGYYEPHPRHGFTDARDPDLITALRRFKRDFGLKENGTVYWHDGTEKMLNAALALNPEGHYVWRTMRDGKVRHGHARRNGRTFSFTNPPPGGHPGEDYGCRCWVELLGDAKRALREELRKWRLGQEFLTQKLANPVQDAKPSWGTFRFGLHFGAGNGRNVTLSEVGHLSNIISIARRHIYPKLEKQIANLMRKKGPGPLVYRTENSYPEFKGAHWVLGNGTLKTITGGKVAHDGSKLTISAKVQYRYSDEITDPLNHRQRRFGYHSVADLPDFYQIDRIPEEYRDEVAKSLAGADLFFTDMLVGRAYSITGGWETEMAGYVFVEPGAQGQKGDKT